MAVQDTNNHDIESMVEIAKILEEDKNIIKKEKEDELLVYMTQLFNFNLDNIHIFNSIKCYITQVFNITTQTGYDIEMAKKCIYYQYKLQKNNYKFKLLDFIVNKANIGLDPILNTKLAMYAREVMIIEIIESIKKYNGNEEKILESIKLKDKERSLQLKSILKGKK
tara:strand:+ start:145 stop:645 length:501 start_codon:yes stop_codon:yes gene_type:complete